MGVVAILVMLPGWSERILVSSNPEGYISNMVTIGLVAFEMSNNDLDLFYSQIFMYLLRQP